MNLLSISELSFEQITELFLLADRLKLGDANDSLAGKTFILLFPASSLRTRITFEQGIARLGGQCILFPPEALDKKEQLSDVISYIGNWADGVIVRHPDHAKIQELASHSAIPIVNAMSADHHPCEILSDLYAISKRRDNFRQLVYTFIGPPGNIARSWAEAAGALQLRLHHVYSSGSELGPDSGTYTFHTDLDRLLPESDILLTDSWPERHRTEELFAKYQVTLARLKKTKPKAIFNPCPPFYRGEEVSEDAIASDYFAGYGFKQDLLYVQQAILCYCLRH